MKKIFAMLLALALMLSGAMASAGGAMTDKPITFSDFTFGDTFGNIRDTIELRGLDFQYGLYSSRYLADAVSYAAIIAGGYPSKPICFSLSPNGQRKVAGNDAILTLWFAYPEGKSNVENEAIFYAGEYEFPNLDAASIFDELSDKLTQVYGEPFYSGSDIAAAMGEGPHVPDEYLENYNSEADRYQPDYVVWKSSANNAIIVLRTHLQNGDWQHTKLFYISTEADPIFEKAAAASKTGASNDSLEGL